MSATVYRAFDAFGQLLYVGCTVDADVRLAAHAKTAGWWVFHERITRTEYPAQDEASDAEAKAIATEHPRWNHQGRTVPKPAGVEYEKDVARRLRGLESDEAALLRKLKKIRMGLAGVRAEVAAIKGGYVFDDEQVA